jgi:Ku70/Ku80-like protein
MATTIWKGHIAFGLVSFPVRLQAAARSQTVSFNQLHQCDHSRVKQVLFCQAEDKPVSRSELVKGFEYEKDRYVVVEESELDQITRTVRASWKCWSLSPRPKSIPSTWTHPIMYCPMGRSKSRTHSCSKRCGAPICRRGPVDAAESRTLGFAPPGPVRATGPHPVLRRRSERQVSADDDRAPRGLIPSNGHGVETLRGKFNALI